MANKHSSCATTSARPPQKRKPAFFSARRIRADNDEAFDPDLLSQIGDGWHTLSTERTAQHFQTDARLGLTNAEAERRLLRFGANRLKPLLGPTFFELLVNQFKSLLVLLLFVAAAIALAMGNLLEAAAVFTVVVLNAIIGFLTEWKAEQTLAALQNQAAPFARVVRGGVECHLPAAELVPGDLVILEAGAGVPADGRIIESIRLQVAEAALTGEAKAVTKANDPVADAEAPLADRTNLAYMGTIVIAGRGRLLVTGTGAATEIGKIGALIDAAKNGDTPLEEKLAAFSRLLLVLVLGLCAVIVLAGFLRGYGFLYMLEVGISLAIAAVPEGLPAVSTMTLALGMQRMARMGALVRRLPAVETLGSTTVICTDKTGTLTRNEMTVCAFVLDLLRVDVTGVGYSAVGDFRIEGQALDPRSEEILNLALRIGALCNDAKVAHADGKDTVLGDPTEAALIVVAEKRGLQGDELRIELPRIFEQPFDSTTKCMATVHRKSDGNRIMFVKGAPATLLAASASQVRKNAVTEMTADDRACWEVRSQELAGAALRVLALAYRDLPAGDNEGDADATEQLVFVGLVGMSDPVRAEVKTAIATCGDAGIRTIMITGDQPVTAEAIARELNIDSDRNGKRLRIVQGRDLTDLDAAGWQEIVTGTAVFARVSPKHKLQIVEALQQRGEIVAMTGDGVNDAPALKKADVGVAMGVKGTDVAKETADMVIVDDNFATIVRAIEQGRMIYANIIRFILYLFTCNCAELLTVFVALMLGWPLPLGALQILWLNIVTDIFPALALALEPSVPGMMNRPPRDPKEPLLPARLLLMIAWQGLLLAAVTLLAFFLGMRTHGAQGEGLNRATTLAFMTLAIVQVVHVFSARSETRSAFDGRLIRNKWLWAAVALCLLLQVAAVYVPFLRRVLSTVALDANDWGIVVGCSLLPLAIVEIVKWIQRRRARI
jgi:Ca2+-transporting ATPase